MAGAVGAIGGMAVVLGFGVLGGCGCGSGNWYRQGTAPHTHTHVQLLSWQLSPPHGESDRSIPPPTTPTSRSPITHKTQLPRAQKEAQIYTALFPSSAASAPQPDPRRPAPREPPSSSRLLSPTGRRPHACWNARSAWALLTHANSAQLQPQNGLSSLWCSISPHARLAPKKTSSRSLSSGGRALSLDLMPGPTCTSTSSWSMVSSPRAHISYAWL
eukprot:2118843-Prymnesium_polylepis.3